MLEKTKLEELSSELPEKERKELLAKISKNRAREEREEIIRVELNKDERERLISEEMLQISRWGLFILWLKHFFTGRSKRDIFINMKLADLKRRIKQRTAGLSGFETRNLTSKFAQNVYDLYAAVFPLQELYKFFNRDPDFRDSVIINLFNKKYEGAKKDIKDLMTLDEMEDIYARSGYEEEIKRQLLRRFNDYQRKIPDKQFSLMEEGIRPLIYLKNLVLFSFSSLFRHFNYFLGDRLEDNYPYFNHAPAMLMLDQLERLYYAIYLALKLPRDWFCHEEILTYYCLHLRGRGLEEADELDNQEIEHEVLDLSSALTKLIDTAINFDHKVPVLDLVQYFRKDPYYKLVFNIPRLQIRSIYTTAMKKSLLDQLDEKMTEIKRNVVDRKIKEIFKTDQLLELFYYNDKPSFDFRKIGLSYFAYTKSMVLFYNYLSKVYKGYIQDVVQIVNAYALSNNRIIQARLMQHAAGLEELEAKIVLFDRSLSPDEDDGKTLTRYRHRISTDLTQQKMYNNFIVQKDREAKELLDRGEENLLGIKKIFDELSTSPIENVKSILKTIHYHKGKNQTLAHLLRAASDIIADFQNLLDQLRIIEKAS